jgi:hypothetical protein
MLVKVLCNERIKMKHLQQLKRQAQDSEKEKLGCIKFNLDEINKLIAEGKHYAIGLYSLELIEYCESLCEVQTTIRQIDSMLGEIKS